MKTRVLGQETGVAQNLNKAESFLLFSKHRQLTISNVLANAEVGILGQRDSPGVKVLVFLESNQVESLAPNIVP